MGLCKCGVPQHLHQGTIAWTLREIQKENAPSRESVLKQMGNSVRGTLVKRTTNTQKTLQGVLKQISETKETIRKKQEEEAAAHAAKIQQNRAAALEAVAPLPTEAELAEQKRREAIAKRKKLIKTYKKMLRKAHVSKAHMPYIQDAGRSDQLFEDRHKSLHGKKSGDIEGKDKFLMGYASKELYTETKDAWKFDEFSRPIKDDKEKQAGVVDEFLKETASPKAALDASDVIELTTGKKKSPKRKEKQSTYEAMEEQNRLQAKLTRIGYKPPVPAPVGLAPQVAPLLNSEGNHNFVNYDGMWKDGKMHGRGIYTFFNGATYEGSWRNGLRHGRGTLLFSDGTEYIGQWSEGKMQGIGRMKYSNNVVYDGEWVKNKRHGKGVLKFPCGAVYEGDFVVGRQHGRGTWTSPTTLKFIGDWKNGLIEGSGTLFIPEGSNRLFPKGLEKTEQHWPRLSFPELIEHVHAEEKARVEELREENKRLFQTLADLEVADYAESARQQIQEAKEEAERERIEEERRLKEERRIAMKEARKAAIEAAAKAAEELDE